MVKSTKLFRGITNKREFLARAFGRLGILGLMERACLDMAARAGRPDLSPDRRAGRRAVL